MNTGVESSPGSVVICSGPDSRLLSGIPSKSSGTVDDVLPELLLLLLLLPLLLFGVPGVVDAGELAFLVVWVPPSVLLACFLRMCAAMRHWNAARNSQKGHPTGR